MFKKIIIAIAGGALFSMLFAIAQYAWSQSNWPIYPEMPGVVLAMFAVGVHGGSTLTHLIVMLIANFVFYGLITLAALHLLCHGKDSGRP